MGRRPGRSLATLLAAGAVSNLGDGVTLAAAPLLGASVTRDPRAIGAVGVAWSLPWLLFALVSGAVVDRSDRRRLMVGADLVRVVGLAAAVVGGRASIPALAIENIVEMAGLAMLVLLAQDVLGLDARGYGLLLASSGVGGPLGAAATERRYRQAACLAVGGVLGGNGGPGCTAASATRAAWSGRSCS
jgi:MFS family permease